MTPFPGAMALPWWRPPLPWHQVVPAAPFYCCLVWGGLTLAYLTVLAWMYGAAPDD